jgi:clathrin heavy chain
MESKSPQLAEALLRYFVTSGDKECFAACLYTCYELIEPDVVIELAWRNGLMEFAFPFLIQSIREVKSDLTGLQKKTDELLKREDKKAKEQGHPATDYMLPQYPSIMPAPIPPVPGMAFTPNPYGFP